MLIISIFHRRLKKHERMMNTDIVTGSEAFIKIAFKGIRLIHQEQNKPVQLYLNLL